MGSILNMPDRAESSTEEKIAPMQQTLSGVRQAFVCQREELLAALDEPLREDIQRLLLLREEMAELEREDAYVRGTRMGAKMAAALLKGE